MSENTWKESLRARLPLLVLLLCVLQPLLDIAGYWQQVLGLPNTVTFALRVLLLAASLLAGFLLSEHRRRYFLLAGLLAALTALHVLACLKSPFGYREPMRDLSNLVMIYSLPVMTLCFITFYRANDRALDAGQKAMTAVLLLIGAVQLLSAITGTDPHTYPMFELGVLGWFNWTNSQSAILSMLYPVALCFTLRRWPDRILPAALMGLAGGAALFVLGTRLAYASLFAGGFGFAVFLLICDRKKWKQALALALAAGVFLALYPLSPVRRREQVNDERSLELRQMGEELSIETEPDDPERALREEENLEKLETLYRSRDLLAAMMERFGRDRVMEAMGYSVAPDVLRDARREKICFCRMLQEDSGPLSRFFGLDLAEMTALRVNGEGLSVEENFDVENDFHGIFFLTGALGLALWLLMLLGVGLRALLAVLRRPKLCFTPLMGANAIAYGLALIHAFFTASILRRPNASVYLAVILAALWVLAERRTAGEEAAP